MSIPNHAKTVAQWLEYFGAEGVCVTRHDGGKVALETNDEESVFRQQDDCNAENLPRGLLFDCDDHAIQFIRAYC